MGITRRTLAEWRGINPWWDLPKSEVRALSKTEAKKIYSARYWQRCQCDAQPAGIDLALFDYAVNSGPNRAITALQQLVGAEPDGMIGPQTQKALNDTIRLKGIAWVITTYMNQRHAFLKRLATYPVFGRGWSRRIEKVRTLSLELTKAISSHSRKRTFPMDILPGYKTYIIAFAMLIAGIAQMTGVELPGFESSNAMQLMMEAFAIIFLRRGVTASQS